MLHAHIVWAAFQSLDHLFVKADLRTVGSTTELFLLNKGEVIRKPPITKDKVFCSLGVGYDQCYGTNGF
jgi:hypothetical protein